MMRVWLLTTSDVCLTVSVKYIGPRPRTERPRMTKIGTEVAHVTCDSVTTFQVKGSKVNLQGTGAYCGGLPHSLFSCSCDFVGWWACCCSWVCALLLSVNWRHHSPRVTSFSTTVTSSPAANALNVYSADDSCDAVAERCCSPKEDYNRLSMTMSVY